MSPVRCLRVAAEALASLLYPPHCAGCGRPVAAGITLCAPCLRDVVKVEAPFCQVCSMPFFGAIDAPFTCANCHDRHFHFTHAVAPCRSRGIVRDLIHRLKYQRAHHLRHQLATWMLEGLDDARLAGQPCEALVPVPLHATRARWRQFNQAAVLARTLGARTGLPVADCLRRTRFTTTQTRLDRRERMENLRGAFRLRHTAAVKGKHLLLIDDVLTTGCTVEECASVLMAAGAASVRVLVVARG